jgi:ATP-dependent Clp protease ATP-binding subunit ClpB
MNFNKLTLKAQEAVQNAQQIGADNENQAIEPVHLLAAMLQDSDGVVMPVLTKVGVNAEFIRQKTDDLVRGLPKVQGFGGTHLSNDTQRVMQDAFKEAGGLGDEYVSTEHLLLKGPGTYTRCRAQGAEGASRKSTDHRSES